MSLQLIPYNKIIGMPVHVGEWGEGGVTFYISEYGDVRAL